MSASEGTRIPSRSSSLIARCVWKLIPPAMIYSLATAPAQLGAAAAYFDVQRTFRASSFIPMPLKLRLVSRMPHSSSVQDEPTLKPNPTPAPPTVEDPMQGAVG